jgi:hypothetical protein
MIGTGYTFNLRLRELEAVLEKKVMPHTLSAANG